MIYFLFSTNKPLVEHYAEYLEQQARDKQSQDAANHLFNPKKKLKPGDAMYQRMRESLCRMIFTCELSPNLVDHEGFREFLRTWRAEMPLLTSRQLNITASNTKILFLVKLNHIYK